MNQQFEQIRAEFQHRVYSYAWYSLRIAADAEDIAQEAFIRLWQNWAQVDLQQVGGWLMRVTHNLVIDHVRRQKSRPRTTEQELDELPATAQDDHQDTLRTIVEQSISQVKEPYRTTLIMREIQGLPYQDIADVLEISLEQVKTDLFRGRRKLREQVKLHPLYCSDLLHEGHES